MDNEDLQQRVEALGPAERTIQMLLNHTDHMVHNRPGMVSTDGRSPTGAKWVPVTHKVGDDGTKTVFRLDKVGSKTNPVEIGTMNGDGLVQSGARAIGRYQSPGIIEETAVWMYRQVADVWEMDNEFAAKWASHAFGQEHRDLKVVLAAFMLVQSRRGDPIREGGEVIFFDDDHRDIGEAMCLLRHKGGKDLNPKLLLRVGDLLALPGIAAVNRELGFGNSARRPFMGRYPVAITKWLRQREQNPPMLEGLVKAGFRTTVMKLARRVGYKPETDDFFRILRWKQKQSNDGRRTVAIGMEVEAAEDWSELSELEVCEKIVTEKPNYKRLVSLLPSGLTQAILAASIEAGCLSDKDLIILTPTLEEYGILEIPEFKDRWQGALQRAEDQRAANIATRVKSQAAKEGLEDAADKAMAKAVEEVTRNLRVYWFIDKSASMHGAIEEAKRFLTLMLGGFPLDNCHVAVFNTTGSEINVKHASRAGVEQALRGHRASGGTSYGAGVMALAHHQPQDDEDVLFMFIGDEEAYAFPEAVTRSGLRPTAFGLLNKWQRYAAHAAVRATAAQLNIPCFEINEAIFEDPYAVTRTLQRLMASTPVAANVAGRRAAVQRVSLVETILKQDLLQKPVWA